MPFRPVCLPTHPAAPVRASCRYYLNGNDAYRLKLLLPLPEEQLVLQQQEQAALDGLTALQLSAAAGTAVSSCS